MIAVYKQFFLSKKCHVVYMPMFDKTTKKFFESMFLSDNQRNIRT